MLFDQRGCSRSTPHASLQDDTNWHLIEVIECLRRHLGIDRGLLLGGLGGGTLSLAYAEKHPDSVSQLVRRGIFLLRKKEISWFHQAGASALFPDQWEKYLELIPEEERGDLVSEYYKRLTGDDEHVRLEAARAWSQ